VEHNFRSGGEDARLNCKKTINTYGKKKKSRATK
jgi:hypothetical protein